MSTYNKLLKQTNNSCVPAVITFVPAVSVEMDSPESKEIISKKWYRIQDLPQYNFERHFVHVGWTVRYFKEKISV